MLDVFEILVFCETVKVSPILSFYTVFNFDGIVMSLQYTFRVCASVSKIQPVEV